MDRQTLAILIVGALFAVFLLLLVASLVRSRMAAGRLAEAAGPARARPAEPVVAKKPEPVSRREFFRRSLLTSVGLFGAEFGLASVAFLWPNLRGGFGGVIDLGISPEDIKAEVEADNAPFYYGAGRFYVVPYEGDAADTEYEGLVGGGLMALYQKCVHLGCRVPFCVQSQWFECPCHGSKYNRAGEYRDGPAPRGMDRFALRVEDGRVVVDTSSIVIGPVRGIDTIGQDPEGPFCITIGED